MSRPPRLAPEDLAALRRFDAGAASAEDLQLLLAAGLARPVDELWQDEQRARIARGELPKLQLTAVGRIAAEGRTCACGAPAEADDGDPARCADCAAEVMCAPTERRSGK